MRRADAVRRRSRGPSLQEMLDETLDAFPAYVSKAPGHPLIAQKPSELIDGLSVGFRRLRAKVLRPQATVEQDRVGLDVGLGYDDSGPRHRALVQSRT